MDEPRPAHQFLRSIFFLSVVPSPTRLPSSLIFPHLLLLLLCLPPPLLPRVGSFVIRVICRMSHLSSVSLSLRRSMSPGFHIFSLFTSSSVSIFSTDAGHLTVWSCFPTSATQTLIHYSSVPPPSQAAIGGGEGRKYVSATC